MYIIKLSPKLNNRYSSKNNNTLYINEVFYPKPKGLAFHQSSMGGQIMFCTIVFYSLGATTNIVACSKCSWLVVETREGPADIEFFNIPTLN